MFIECGIICQSYIIWHVEIIYPSTWNAKCPIFLGNFTPKTSNYCLKNRAPKAFQANNYPPNCPPKKKNHGTFYTSQDLTLRRTISTPRSCQRVTPTGPMIRWLPASRMQTGWKTKFSSVRKLQFCCDRCWWNNDSIIPIQNFGVNFRKLKHHVHYSSQLEPDHFQSLFVSNEKKPCLFRVNIQGILLPSYVAITIEKWWKLWGSLLNNPYNQPV